MRLLKQGQGECWENERGECEQELELYVDCSYGVVYALSPSRRDELDPLWRDDTPEGA